jgi:hypothetical protein
MNLNKLPEVIVDLIKEFIPHFKVVFLNSKYYNAYHYILRNHIPQYDNYVRDIINRDNEMVFKYIARENFERWLKNIEYRYKDMIFNNYIYFVLYYCVEHNSEKCREILIDYLSERNLYKNLHKKNVVKYIKWNN